MNGPGADDPFGRLSELVSKSASEPDLRFRWLEAFVVTARHLSYDGAAAELGSCAPRVKRAVENLEKWLHSLLVIGEKDVELFTYNGIPYAELFLKAAIEALESVKALAKPAPTGRSLPDIWLSQFISLMAVKAAGTYQGAATDMGLSHDQVRRKVKELERMTGHKLVLGRTTIVPSPDGEHVATAGMGIAARLLDSIAEMPSDGELFVNRFLRRRAPCIARKSELSLIIKRAGAKKRLSKYDKQCLAAAREQLEQIDRILEGMSELLPPATGRDIEI